MEDAYRLVFDEHHRRLANIAAALSGDRHRAEDAAAEAFARVYPKWRSGRVDKVGAYLQRTVINEVYKAHRRRDRRLRIVGRPAVGAASDDGLATELWLTDALLTLSKRQRAVLVLRFLDDRSEQQTADLLGMAVGTVKSATSRGLTALRDHLGSQADATAPTAPEDDDVAR